MKWTAIIAAFLAIAIAGYYFLYPPKVLERKTEAALMDFAKVVATKDRAKIGQALGRLLTDDAKIHLDVSFFSLSKIEETGSGGKVVGQDFDKASFLTFIDNILYTLEDYSYEPVLRDFTLSPDHKNATITFASREFADGVSYYGGTAVNVRFSSVTFYDGDVSFAGAQPALDKLTFKMELRMVPKPDQAAKFQNNPDAIRQLLQ